LIRISKGAAAKLGYFQHNNSNPRLT